MYSASLLSSSRHLSSLVTYYSYLMLLCLVVLTQGCTTSSSPYEHLKQTNFPTREISSEFQYKLGIGDQIAIKFFYNPELNEELVIRPDGKAAMQLIGDVVMAGKTVEQLRGSLSEAYANIIKTPEVSVIVRGIESQQIFVGGEVSKPGMYQAKAGITPLQAIFLAGGYKNTAELSSVILLRDSGEPVLDYYIVDIQNNLKNPAQAKEIKLQPRDVIFIPPTRIATINQFVDQYIQKMMPIFGNLNFSVIYDVKGDD